MKFILNPGELKLKDIRTLLDENTVLELDKTCHEKIHASEKIISNVIQQGKIVYGINTGFGALASTIIPSANLEDLQRRIVLSHAAGTGELFADNIVRLILALKINSLARGFSGVKMQTIDTLIRLFNEKIYPCIPSQGSVGASGDLAPLAHLSAVLLGVGTARHAGKIISAEEALEKIQLKPLKLGPKEGLALLNGTQVSTALALIGLFTTEEIFVSAIVAGAMSVDAAKGSDKPFDARIQLVRGHATQIQVAAWLKELLADSQIRESHRNCQKVQDPYSLRCQPQVMGACLAQLNYVTQVLLTEANAVSDNPLIFADDHDIISGGNFHAEPVALAADALAVSIAEIGALSERRTALLVDPHFSGLPAFLVNNPGINSGFMIAQVTSAALASENKSLAHPASVDSLPTSANQEDHVSMATYAARRLLNMTDNAAGIVGIELLAAAQGLDLLSPLKTSLKLQKIHDLIRENVAYYAEDRFFAPDIEKIKSLILTSDIRHHARLNLF
ncbi:MAG: hypothetical protein ACD_46C00695G0008 [uncultured bacterium]|nr:MAG: hypothetical protein ACD_46C00695G0008 [uncultured bacterium]